MNQYQHNLRFPNTGTISSDFNGVTATFSGTLVVQSASNPHVKSEGEGLGGSIHFMNNNFKIGIRVKDNSGNIKAYN